MASRLRRCSGLILILSAIEGCGGSSGNPSAPSPGSTDPAGGASSGLTLRASPIDPDKILWITPLGNLNPPAHTLPTDHIYFYFANPDNAASPVLQRTAFFAPADGTVFDIFSGNGSDSKIFVRVSATLAYYIDHLIPDATLSRGMRLTAGQRLGTTGSSFGVDLGVVNDAKTLAFVNPSRYESETLHTDAPLKYFEEPLRSRLYAMVQRIGPDLDGRIDYDVAGRLAGNWFAGDATPVAFVHDTYDPAKVLISVGGGTLMGVYAIAPGDPDPSGVSVGSGKVLYSLTRSITGPHGDVGGIAARMLVQMLDDTHLREEVFVSSSVASDFSANASTLSR